MGKTSPGETPDEDTDHHDARANLSRLSRAATRVVDPIGGLRGFPGEQMPGDSRAG